MRKIKIAIIDDHQLFREGIKLVLNQTNNFEIIYESDNGNDFINFLDKVTPDVVLMDINMAKLNGIETTKKALKIKPTIKILTLSMYSDTLHYTQMINAGVKGFLLKNANIYELKQSITEVFNGGNYFSQKILQKLASKSLLKINNNLKDEITEREGEILYQICNGLTSSEIAEKLYISIKTVEVHRTNIFRKANVRNVAELIIWAIKNNYFSLE